MDYFFTMCTKLSDIQRYYKYFVIKFLRPPDSVEGHVYISSKWIRDFDIKKRIAKVAYPTEDYMITEELVKSNENVGENTKVWYARLVRGCDSHENAQQILEEILNNKFKQKISDNLSKTSEAQIMDEITAVKKQTQKLNPSKKRSNSLDSAQVLDSTAIKKPKPIIEMRDASNLSTSNMKVKPIQLSKTESGKYAIKSKENTNQPPSSFVANENAIENSERFLNETMKINDCISTIRKNMQQFKTIFKENDPNLSKMLSFIKDLVGMKDLVGLQENDGSVDSDSANEDNDNDDDECDDDTEDDDNDNYSINDGDDGISDDGNDDDGDDDEGGDVGDDDDHGDIENGNNECDGEDDENDDVSKSRNEEMTSDEDYEEEPNRSKLRYKTLNSENKWTLKYQKKEPGTTELVLGSGIYVNAESLKRYVYLESNKFDMTRMLCHEVFTKNALSKCYLRSTVAPALDFDGIEAILDFVKHTCFVKSDKEIRDCISKLLYNTRQKQR